MIAVVQDRYGPPSRSLRVAQVDVPRPGPGEVRVRVHATSVHADIWHVIHGRPLPLRFMGSGLRRPLPPIPGTDVAGTVDAVGSGVTAFRPGDRVFGSTVRRHEWMHGGAWAEYAVARDDRLVALPADTSFAQAATLPSAGHIALQNLRDDVRAGPGRSVLVNGAGGAVGSIALQVTRGRGAHVTAVELPRKLDLVRRLGAEQVVDGTADDFTTHLGRYDLVFDVPGTRPYRHCRRALAPGGRYVTIGHEAYGRRGGRTLGIMPGFFALMLRARFDARLRGPGTPLPDRSTTLAQLGRLLDDGVLDPVVDRVLPLERAVEALDVLTSGANVGAVVLAPGPQPPASPTTPTP